ncbi:MAG: hypothetical protein U0904_09910 [Candidatus Nanopelagicales bacterium]|nr:hypothetical protein [Candidatus Nanopelagicales bacterium]
MRLGVLDIGSNTVHLLVVDAHYGAAPIPAFSRKIELRLSEHLTPEGLIDAEAIESLIRFVREALVAKEDLGVSEFKAFATSAVRDAANGGELLWAVKDATGVDIDVLSGEDEARLTFLAVRRWYGWSSGRLLVLDIGGGSLEIAVGGDEEPEWTASLPLGAGLLTRTHLAGDPPRQELVRELRKAARAQIADVAGRIQRMEATRHAVATSKTFKQLARIAGSAPSAEGQFVRRTLAGADLSEWLPKLAAMTAQGRASLPGVSVGRAGQLVAGAVVAEAAMDLLGIETLDVCPWALREGIILRRLDGLEH